MIAINSYDRDSPVMAFFLSIFLLCRPLRALFAVCLVCWLLLAYQYFPFFAFDIAWPNLPAVYAIYSTVAQVYSLQQRYET